MKTILLLLLAFTASAPAVAQQPQPLITNPPHEVTSVDFEAFLLRIPAAYRPEVRASMERIGKAVDQVYANRVLAAEAKKLGIDQDPVVRKRLEQVQEAALATLWMDRYRETVKVPDLTQRAEELYKVNRARFTEPERFTGQFLLVSLNGRTRASALEYATQLRARAAAGDDFANLVASFSEDPNVRRSHGRLNAVSINDLEKPISDAAFALKAKGDITQPIETKNGFTIVRMESRTPGRVKPFAEVKADLIEDEERKYRDFETDAQAGRLKNTPQTVVHTKNLEALRRELSEEDITRLHREAAKAGEAPKGR